MKKGYALRGLSSVMAAVFGLSFAAGSIAEGYSSTIDTALGTKSESFVSKSTKDDPLYSVKGGENAFVFYTERYQPIPLTVRGYGAGAGVTAAGVFGDILRTVSFNPEEYEKIE